MNHFELTADDFSHAPDNWAVGVLPNGVRVVTVTRPVNSLTVSVYLNVGSRNESLEESGMSHFLEHMAFKGTTTRSASAIATEIERIGAEINAYTSYSETVFVVDGLAHHLIPALDILSDVVQNSVLDPLEIAREQEVVVQEIRESRGDFDSLSQDHFLEAAYDGALGRPVIGTEENVRSFDQSVVRSYMDRYYRGPSAIVVATGPIEHEAFLKEVGARFDRMNGGPAADMPAATYVGRTSLRKIKSVDRARVDIGFPIVGSLSPDFPKFSVLADILGGGASSPLFQKIREEHSLAYQVDASIFRQTDHAVFVIGGGTIRQSVEKLIQLTLVELRAIADGSIADADWERSRNQLLRALITNADKPESVGRQIAHDLFALGRGRTMREIIMPYLALTRTDVVDAAQRLLKTRPTIAVIGDVPKIDISKTVKADLKFVDENLVAG